MNWRKKILWSASIASLGVFTACHSDVETGKTINGKEYKRFIATQNEGVADSLLLKPTSNNYVAFRAKIYNANDSLLIEAGHQYDMPAFIPIRNAAMPKGIEELLVLGAEGDSLEMTTTAGEMMFRGMDPQDDLTIRVRLLNVYDNMPAARAASDSLGKLAQEKRTAFIEMRFEEENGLIQEYAKENNLELLQAENGTYYVITEAGSGEKFNEGETAAIHYRGTLLEDGSEFDNSYKNNETFKFKPGQKRVIAGWDAVIPLLDEGSKATLLIPSKLGYSDRKQPTIPANSILKFDVEVDKFMNDEELAVQRQKDLEARQQKEKDDLVAYVKDHSLSTQTTDSGLKYIITENGTGDMPVAGDTVSVHYTGTLLNGDKFDSSLDRGEPIEFVLGRGQVIKGWDEGIALLKKGAKATLLIPSGLAYGERGSGSKIPGFSPLNFEVELVDIKKAN